MCGVGIADDVEASDAAVEPEAGDVGEVGCGDGGIKVEEDTDVAAAGFVDEVVETIEGAEGRGRSFGREWRRVGWE